jgi:hypothetical protein
VTGSSDFGTQALTLLIPLGTFIAALVVAFFFRRPAR